MDKSVEKLISEGEYDKAKEIAYQHYEKYELDEAEEIYNELYDRIIDEKGRHSEDAAEVMKALADIAYEQNNYELALSLYNSAYEWCKQNDAVESRFSIENMMRIADLYRMFNRYDDRYEICRKALDISINAYGENDSVTCYVLRKLADSCTDLERYDEAMTYYEHVLELLNNSENQNIDEIARAYDGMGYVYKYRGMPQKAKECFETGIRILEDNYDEDTELLLGMYNDLCNIYDRLSLLDEALKLRRDILDRTTALYGFEHHNVLVSKSNLADAYNDVGDFETALKLYEECVDWVRVHLGATHHETVRNMRCLSRMYSRVGRYDDALKIAQEAHSIMVKALGEHHIDVLMMLEDIAFLYIEFYNYPAARDIFTQTSEYFLENCGKDSDYFYSRENYLYVCALSGGGAEIIEEADDLLELGSTFAEPVDTDNLLEVKAIANKNIGNYKESIRLMKEVVRINEDKYGAENIQTFGVKIRLARIYFDMKSYDEAMCICQKISDGFDRKNINNNDSYQSKIILARCFSAVGEYDRASEITDKLLSSMDISTFRAPYADACYAAAENCMNMGQWHKAFEYANKCLEYRRCIFEEDYFGIKDAEKLVSKIGAMI